MTDEKSSSGNSRRVVRKGTVVAARTSDKVAVENVNHPGHFTRVDAAMYAAMKRAFLKALPSAPPGLTQTEIRGAVLLFLPADLFPKGAKAGWWSKSVQLDLEAKGLVAREKTTPLRWHKV